MRLAIDCANGATTTVAPRLFEDLGFEVHHIGSQPDGRNINRGCGSTAPEPLSKMVVEGRFPIGVAYDGDGDRAIFVDGSGKVVDGDAVMLMCAKQMKAEGRLKGNAIVATVMSNIGLEIALRDRGLALVRTAVGDKYVMEEMVRRGYALGGEQSGHIVLLDHATTGDGTLTALSLLGRMTQTGRPLAELTAVMQRLPQVLVNVRVIDKSQVDTSARLRSAIAAAETRLAGTGRVLVRPSGTEPVVRVMVEAPTHEEAQDVADRLVDAVDAALR
jgi:phosphoglucosamine mutase